MKKLNESCLELLKNEDSKELNGEDLLMVKTAFYKQSLFATKHEVSPSHAIRFTATISVQLCCKKVGSQSDFA